MSEAWLSSAARVGGAGVLLLVAGVACDRPSAPVPEVRPPPSPKEAVLEKTRAEARPAAIVEIPVTTTVSEAAEAFGRGRDLAERGRVEEALPLFQKAVQLDKKFALGLAYLGFFTPTEEGNAMLDRAVALAEPLPEAEKLLVEHLRTWRHADTGALTAQRKRLKELAPTDWRVHLMAAMGAREAKLWPECTAELEEALKLNPHAVPAYELLGEAQVAQSRFDDAIATLTKATKEEANEPGTFDALGEAQLRTGRFADAEASFRTAQGLPGASPDARLGVAQSRFLRGDWKGGREALDLTRVEDSTLAVWSLLAENRPADAVKAAAALDGLSKAKKDGATWASVPVFRAIAFLLQGKPQPAADEATSAIGRVAKAGVQGDALARLYRTALLWQLKAELTAGKLKDADETDRGLQKAASLVLSPEAASTRAHGEGLMSRAHKELTIALQQLLECQSDDFLCRVDLADTQEANGDSAAAAQTRAEVIDGNRRDGTYLLARALAQGAVKLGAKAKR